MRLTPWKLAALPLALTMVATGCGSDSDSGSAGSTTVADQSTTTAAGTDGDLSGEAITLYSGRDEELIAPLIEKFEEQTGATVEVRYGSSAEMGAALLEEGDNTKADVFYSQEVGAVGEVARAGLLSPLPDEVVELVDERFRPADDNLWVGITGRSRVIAYNPDLISEPPAGMLELTDEKYNGQVGWVPGNAGFQATITGFRVTQGDDAAKEWLEGVKANGAVSYEKNGELLNAVNDGDVAIGLINHYYWGRLANELGADNVTAQLIFPKGEDPGALVNATAAGITTKGAQSPASLALIEFLLSEEGQQTFVDETYEYPLVSGVEGPEGFPPLSELQGPKLDLTDLDSLVETQELISSVGLLD